MIKHMISFIVILAAFAILPSGMANEIRSLVLVSYVGGNDVRLTTPEIRRLYLGLPTSHQPPLTAVINRTEPLLYQVFLQKALFMSAPLYERQLMANVVRQGSGYRPQMYNNQQELLSTLRKQRNAVTFMWRDQLRADAGMVVVAVVWQGRVN